MPLLYEVNTRCWLLELSEQRGRPITLANVPDDVLAEWQRMGFTHIWLMGVWTSGPRVRARALEDREQRRFYAASIPDLQDEDITGSPYAISAYEVPSRLGGEAGLKAFKMRLNSRGLKLLLDFVPNHLGLDHPWLKERPDLFVQTEAEVPETFPQNTNQGPRRYAHGKDPYFAAWTDTVQLDYRRAETHAAMTDLLCSVAGRCDGVRCDMAMLLLSDVFARTWARFPLREPSGAIQKEFWPEAIAAVKHAFPGFIFLAEVYWGLEARLQELGFDFTYDKELYDRLVDHDAAGAQRHVLRLAGEPLRKGVHFLENHDEPRIASRLSLVEQRAAALLILSLPGMTLLHEGQLSGAALRAPVQLLRRFPEPERAEVRQMYEQLLDAVRKTAVGSGIPQIIPPRKAWEANATEENFVLVRWQGAGDEFSLAVVNLAAHSSQCLTPLADAGVRGKRWVFHELLSGREQVHSGDELAQKGLYVDAPAHAAQLFHCRPR